MTVSFLHDFIARHRYAVIATLSAEQFPESALVGFAVAPDLRLIFDTVTTSRKYRNLIQNPAIAAVIGWENEQTVQYEGFATVPEPEDLEAMLPYYYEVFPDGRARREAWKDLVYFAVQPHWIRYSDFNIPQRVEELRF